MEKMIKGRFRADREAAATNDAEDHHGFVETTSSDLFLTFASSSTDTCVRCKLLTKKLPHTTASALKGRGTRQIVGKLTSNFRDAA